MNIWVAIVCVALCIAGAVSAGAFIALALERNKRRKEQAMTPLLGVVLPPEKGN